MRTQTLGIILSSDIWTMCASKVMSHSICENEKRDFVFDCKHIDYYSLFFLYSCTPQLSFTSSSLDCTDDIFYFSVSVASPDHSKSGANSSVDSSSDAITMTPSFSIFTCSFAVSMTSFVSFFIRLLPLG